YRSKSCPQCREKVTEKKIHRLYFTFSSNDTTTDYQTSPLQEKVDNLKFQILLKEREIEFHSSKSVTLMKQNTGLKEEVTKLEGEINKKNAAIHALNEQIKYFKEENLQCDYLKSRIAHLKSKIGELKPIQTLLRSPLSDVSKMIQNTKDPDILTRYISIMKKELIQSFEKCHKLQTTVKRLKAKLSKNNTKSDTSLEEQEEQIGFEEKLAAPETVRNINKKYDDVSDTGSQSNSSKEILLEGDSKAKNQITSNKSSVIKYTTSRKTNKVSVRSTENVQDKLQIPQIELNTSNSDLELISCSPSGFSPMVPKTFCLIEGNSSSSNDDINESRLGKKRKMHTTDNTSCTDVIDLT
ncbi:uncharacterized protein LOC108625107, partial [Ceratina calcarata]|uniref:Uncharacterized protein LOC108625107 n=1 Tax=Ceratina calcarata TaxID=156304 RepID=A0AAJ7N6Q9_9HYME